VICFLKYAKPSAGQQSCFSVLPEGTAYDKINSPNPYISSG